MLRDRIHSWAWRLQTIGSSRPSGMGLLPDMWNCGLRMRRECQERFPRHRRLVIPTCITARAVTHVRWCMPGSLTRGFLWRRWWEAHTYASVNLAIIGSNNEYLGFKKCLQAFWSYDCNLLKPRYTKRSALDYWGIRKLSCRIFQRYVNIMYQYL